MKEVSKGAYPDRRADDLVLSFVLPPRLARGSSRNDEMTLGLDPEEGKRGAGTSDPSRSVADWLRMCDAAHLPRSTAPFGPTESLPEHVSSSIPVRPCSEPQTHLWPALKIGPLSHGTSRGQHHAALSSLCDRTPSVAIFSLWVSMGSLDERIPQLPSSHASARLEPLAPVRPSAAHQPCSTVTPKNCNGTEVVLKAAQNTSLFGSRPGSGRPKSSDGRVVPALIPLSGSILTTDARASRLCAFSSLRA